MTENSKEIVVPKELEPILKEVRDLAFDCDVIEVHSREDYAVAHNFMDKLYERNKKVDALLDPIIRAAYATHKTATQQKLMLTTPIANAIAYIKNKMTTFLMEEKKRAEGEAEMAKKKLIEAGFDANIVGVRTGLPIDNSGMVQVEV